METIRIFPAPAVTGPKPVYPYRHALFSDADEGYSDYLANLSRARFMRALDMAKRVNRAVAALENEQFRGR